MHSLSCSRTSFTCPKHLAAGSVDSLMGRLRAIFNSLGRLNASNPVVNLRVKHDSKFVRQEQAGLAITPTQEVHLFFDRFRRLIAFVRSKCVHQAPLSRSDKDILVRDATFFVVNFFTGHRASGLGHLKCRNIFRLRDREGYFLRRTFAKNIRTGSTRSFALNKLVLLILKFALWPGFSIILQFASASGFHWTKDTFLESQNAMDQQGTNSLLVPGSTIV